MSFWKKNKRKKNKPTAPPARGIVNINREIDFAVWREKKFNEVYPATDELLSILSKNTNGWCQMGYSWILYSQGECIAVMKPSVSERPIKQYVNLAKESFV